VGVNFENLESGSRKEQNESSYRTKKQKKYGSGSASVLGMQNRIQEPENRSKLTNKPDFQSYKMSLYLRRYVL
jgi:hypothetical protein